MTVADSDDAPIGRILRRREVLALLGGSGAALLAACTTGALASPAPSAGRASTLAPSAGAPAASTAGVSTAVALPSCVVRPALTEGPYFVDEKLNRADIRSEPASGALKQGTPLSLSFNVARVSGGSCVALAGATVDVWHCDALGVYSDAQDPSFNTRGQKFLRGYQVTDASGKAAFTTIYPGWYQGRAVHIHFKIRTVAANGAVSDFTSQLFFDDAVNEAVFAQAPYAQKGRGWLRNGADGIYQGAGDKLLLKPTRSGDGHVASFDIGLMPPR